MSERSGQRPRRPAFVSPAAMEALGGSYDPTAAVHLAHETAAVLVHEGRAATDPEVTARLVALVEEIGVAAVAALWSERPARSLPGALWRLYALREWVRRNPVRASREYAAGARFAEAHHVVAGAATPYGPREVESLAEAILRGVYRGDLAVALDRAAGFCMVVAAGRADVDVDPVRDEPVTPSAPRSATDRAASLLDTGRDLAACARLWREGRLE